MKILVTGGTGFIGSHTTAALLKAGHEVVIIDNLSNSERSVLDSLQSITEKQIPFYEGNLLNPSDLDRVFSDHHFDGVIHFAALKAVGESVAEPLRYYENNVGGSINLLKAMDKAGVRQIVFSSSATVYGEHNTCPYNETMPIMAINPYGWTKVMMERVLTDWSMVAPSRKVILLRYFNPVGAHESGQIGENPLGKPNNLMPLICHAAKSCINGGDVVLKVYGNDYDTPDGTGVRDYIHVCDLAEGHVKAIEHMPLVRGTQIYNLGTGHGVSVLEMIKTFEQVNQVKVPHEIAPRRPGDSAWSYADASKAEKELGWKAVRDLSAMCRDSWQFYSKKN